DRRGGVDRAELAQERQVQVVNVLVGAEHQGDVREVRRAGRRPVVAIVPVGQERVDEHPAAPRRQAEPGLAVPGQGDGSPGPFGTNVVQRSSLSTTGSGSVPALCSTSRQRPCRRPRTDQEQFDSGPSTPNRSSGMPSSRDMPSRSAAPWLTTTARPVVIAGSETASATRSSAPATRSATTADGSPSGGVQLACSAG